MAATSPTTVPASAHQGLSKRQEQGVALSIFSIILPVVFIVLRLVSRRMSNTKLWWDDYLAITSMIFSWGVPITTILCIHQGMGKHVSEVTPEQSVTMGKISYALEIIYCIAYSTAYLALLTLYLRVFSTTWLRKAYYMTGTFVVAHNTSCLIIVIFQCTPIRYIWDKSIKGHCINEPLSDFINSIIFFIELMVAIALPIPVLWNLNVSRCKKWSLLAAFTVGGFVVFIGIVRLIAIRKSEGKDPTYSLLNVAVWSAIELSAGVVSTCLSSLMPIIYFLLGHKNKARSTPGPEYPAYGRFGLNTAHVRRFNRMENGASSALPFAQGTIELSNKSHAVIDEADNVRLVDPGTPPNKVGVNTTVSMIREQGDEKGVDV